MFAETALLLAGTVILLWSVADAVASSVGFSEGRMTRAVEQGFCHLATGGARLLPGRRFLVWSGPIVIAGMLAFRVLLLWAGWTLIVLAYRESFGIRGQQLDFWDAVYVAGYCISTLGIGDAVPLSPQAQMVAVLASLSGLLLITYVIAFITPIASGRAEKQTLARRINRALERGVAPDAVASSELDALARMEQAHQAHPVLHRFAGPDREASLSIAISRLLPGLNERHAGYPEVLGLLRTLSAAAIGPDNGSAEPMDQASAWLERDGFSR